MPLNHFEGRVLTNTATIIPPKANIQQNICYQTVNSQTTANLPPNRINKYYTNTSIRFINQNKELLNNPLNGFKDTSSNFLQLMELQIYIKTNV